MSQGAKRCQMPSQHLVTIRQNATIPIPSNHAAHANHFFTQPALVLDDMHIWEFGHKTIGDQHPQTAPVLHLLDVLQLHNTYLLPSCTRNMTPKKNLRHHNKHDNKGAGQSVIPSSLEAMCLQWTCFAFLGWRSLAILFEWGGGGGNRLEGPSCTISHNDVFPQGLAEGEDMILYRDP